MLTIAQQQLPRIGDPILGIIIPAAIFGISFWISYRLYRKFAGKVGNKPDE